jgi:hypothetical protein
MLAGATPALGLSSFKVLPKKKLKKIKKIKKN